jgi:hypothetical protein
MWRRRVVKTLIWLPAVLAGWHFLGDYFAPEGCMDSGGSFDYLRWQCGYQESLPYIYVPMYGLLSFWMFIAGLVLAIGIQSYLRKNF